MSVPHRVVRAAAEERLGAARGAHAPRPADRSARLWMVVLALPGLVLLPFTAIFLTQGFGWASGLSVVLTVVYLGAAGRILVRQILPARGPAAYVFELGLVVASLRSVTAFPWDRVDEVRVSGVRRTGAGAVTWRLALKRADGVTTSVDVGGAGGRSLVEVVSHAVTERVLPAYLTRVEAGGQVRLGPFTIDRSGIVESGERVPWEHVADVEIRGGMIYLHRADRPVRVAATAAEVPNAVAFGELARRLRLSAVRPYGAGSPGGGPSGRPQND